MLYLMTHSTHFYLRLHGVRQMVKDQSDSERGKPAAATWATLSNLYALFHSQDKTYHGLCYTSRGALAGNEK